MATAMTPLALGFDRAAFLGPGSFFRTLSGEDGG